MNTLKNKTNEVKRIRDLQKQSLETSSDNYMVGLYNGLEFAVAIMEGREPEFFACVGEPPIVDNTEEQTGRTIASGVRRR